MRSDFSLIATSTRCVEKFGATPSERVFSSLVSDSLGCNTMCKCEHLLLMWRLIHTARDKKGEGEGVEAEKKAEAAEWRSFQANWVNSNTTQLSTEEPLLGLVSSVSRLRCDKRHAAWAEDRSACFHPSTQTQIHQFTAAFPVSLQHKNMLYWACLCGLS